MLKQIETALDPKQINKFFKENTGKNIRIINTNQIEPHKYTLSDLFTKDMNLFKCSLNNAHGSYNDNVLILYTPVSSPNSGHFQALMQSDNVIYFFDSYGHDYKYLIDYVNSSDSTSVRLNNNFASLVVDHALPMYHNTFQYQSNSNEDDTCGRHSSVCAMYFLNNLDNFNFNNYFQFVEKFKTENGYKGEFAYDDVVTEIFDKHT